MKIRLFSLVTCIAAFVSIAPPAEAFYKEGTVSVLGGYNGNVDLLPDGSPGKDDSLFGRAFVFLWFDWDIGNRDKLYVSLANDNLLYLNSGESSSIFLRAAPGYRFKTMADRLDTDISLAIANNTSFDDSDANDDGRTRNTRSAKPNRELVGHDDSSTSSTFFANDLRVKSLYDMGSWSVGPVLRLAKTEYTKVPQEDDLFVLSALAMVDFNEKVAGTFELGLAETDSTIQSLGYDAQVLSARIDWVVESGFELSAALGHASRDFESPNTRDDRLTTLELSLEKNLADGRVFEFDFTRAENASTSAGADYTAYIVAAGLRWTLF